MLFVSLVYILLVYYRSKFTRVHLCNIIIKAFSSQSGWPNMGKTTVIVTSRSIYFIP